MIFDKDTWLDVGKGFTVYDCAYRGPDLQAFIFMESTERTEDLECRIVFTYNDEEEPEERFYCVNYSGLDFPRIAFRPQPNETVVVTLNAFVYSYTPDEDDPEDNFPGDLAGTNLVSPPAQIVRIGENLYTVGSARRMQKRIGNGKWQEITKEIPVPQAYLDVNGDEMSAYDWRDASGFSENDIYACGGHGDLWHFDGKIWRQVDFPSNELLNNICCAEDGNVYIGGNLGRLWMGRNDEWKLVSDNEFSMPWKDIAFFQGMLYLGSDFGLWTFNGKEIATAETPVGIQLCAGSCIDISYEKDRLLTAGQHGACLFDGKNWEILFDRSELE